MPGPTSDALRDALQAMSDSLDKRIGKLPAGSGDRASLEDAQGKLENAAADVSAAKVEDILTNDNDLQVLTDLTEQINASADSIASSQASVEKVINIGKTALKLGELLSGAGTASAVVTAARNVKSALKAIA